MRGAKRIAIVLALVVILAGTIGFQKASGTAVKAARAEENTITTEAFVKKLEKAAGLEKGILLQEENPDTLKKELVWKQAAVLANLADELKNGASYDKDLYKAVVKGKRLTGLKPLSKEEKKAVRLCFVKGLLAGNSKGEYTQKRAFHAEQSVTRTEAKKLIACVKNEEKRTSLSPDGQVIRTKNLPSNYEKFDYILESFPNEFYEMEFDYERVKFYYEPINLEHYACPSDMKRMDYAWSSVTSETGAELVAHYGNAWLDTIQTNLSRRFQFDYRTADEAWISDLASTYIYDDDSNWNNAIVKSIKSYVEKAKKNHVIVKADKIVIEPSTFYYSTGYFMVRCHIRFKVNADNMYTAESGKQADLIYSYLHNVSIKGLEKDQWYEMTIDVPVEQTAGNQNPSTYSIWFDVITPWE